MLGQRMFCISYRCVDFYFFHSISNGNSWEMSITEALQHCSLVWLMSGFTFTSQEYTWSCDKLISIYIRGSWSTEVWYLASTLRHESGACRFLEPLRNVLLPPSAVVAVAWWVYPESWHGSSPVALCPRSVDEEPLEKTSPLILSPKLCSLFVLVFALKHV